MHLSTFLSLFIPALFLLTCSAGWLAVVLQRCLLYIHMCSFCIAPYTVAPYTYYMYVCILIYV
jgi:hypothetical protein